MKTGETGAKTLIISSINDLKAWLEGQRKLQKTIGFVPTMGALHKGHTSLMDRAKKENDLVVVSIFVNPTQFNVQSDLANYPRTPERDEELMAESQVDVVFIPSIDEIYKGNLTETPIVDIGELGDVMEGEHRPGHFAGVIQVVSKLFDIVNADKAYFGEKDFQQLAVIRFMVKQLHYNIEIVPCPTVREESGLAMSSRNLRLSDKGRQEAAGIFSALISAKAQYKKYLPALLKQHVKDQIEQSGFLKTEYIEIADEDTLQPAGSWEQFEHCRIFAAVFCEGIRLIDNVRLF